MRTHQTKEGDIFVYPHIITPSRWEKSAYRVSRKAPDKLRPLAIMFATLAIVSASVAVGAWIAR